MPFLTALATLIATIGCNTLLNGQCPPPGDFSINTQAEIDNFPVNYPGCTEIDGALFIEDSDITNLDGLAQLTHIDGFLVIHRTEITSLLPLQGLTSIDGLVSIQENSNLTSLSGLDNIEVSSIFSLDLQFNDNLSICNLDNICSFIENPPSPPIIDGNALGCDSAEEIQNSCSVVPVELGYFDVKLSDREVVLNWQTLTETENDYFQIEHSQGGIVFEALGEVRGMGTIYTPNEYDFVHTEPSAGTNYYRLRIIDFDNGFTFSNIVSIKFNSPVATISPNPATEFISISEPDFDNTDYTIIDLSGRAIIKGRLKADENLDISNLSPGIYFVQVSNGKYDQIGRFVKI